MRHEVASAEPICGIAVTPTHLCAVLQPIALSLFKSKVFGKLPPITSGYIPFDIDAKRKPEEVQLMISCFLANRDNYPEDQKKKYDDYKQGLSALVENHYRGNRRNMSFEEEAELLESFRKEAEAGHIVDVREIKAAYEEKVGHSIGGSQIYYVLSRHNWCKVLPRSKHPKKASEEVIVSGIQLIHFQPKQ